jgi:DNA replication protein DnaC
MKTYQADQIKNIALLGNSGSGKTTLAEAMLFNGGVIERRGTIEGKKHCFGLQSHRAGKRKLYIFNCHSTQNFRIIK